MVSDDVITGYLAQVRALVGVRRNVDAIVAELEDHLRSSVESHIRDGLDANTAQLESLEALGDAGFVAYSLCQLEGGGVALPTRQSRLSGFAALLAAGLVLVVVVPAYFHARGVLDGHDTTASYYAMGALLVLAGIVSIAVLVGMLDRSGFDVGVMFVSVTGVAIFGVCIVAVAPWSHPVTMALLWGPCVFGLVCLARVVSLPFAVWATSLAWPACVGMLYLLQKRTELGSIDQYGGHPWATFVATATFAGLWSVGFLALGRTLASERPVLSSAIPVVTG